MLTTIGLSAAGAAVLYRAVLYVLGKGKAGSIANGLFKVLGGGGPSEEGPPPK